jgi:hypothetical protein
MKAQGFDPAPLALLKYNPNQPRVPAGSGRASGEWTSGGAGGSDGTHGNVTPVSYRTRARLKALNTFLEWLRSQLKGSKHETPPEKAPPVREEAKPAPKPPEAKQPPIVDANKLHHIFDNPDHPFGDFVSQYGSQEEAFRAIEDATRNAVREQNITGEYKISIELGGRRLIVKGYVLPDGAIKIGTAYPWNN